MPGLRVVVDGQKNQENRENLLQPKVKKFAYWLDNQIGLMPMVTV
jgi:hypothetical protein